MTRKRKEQNEDNPTVTASAPEVKALPITQKGFLRPAARDRNSVQRTLTIIIPPRHTSKLALLLAVTTCKIAFSCNPDTARQVRGA